MNHALTKHPPFDGEDAMAVVKARLDGPPVPMKNFRPDIDPEISEIIDRMLQLEPAMRYPTYGSLLSDMRRYLDHAQPHSSTPIIGGGNKRIIIKGRGHGKTSQVLSTTSSLNATGRHPLVVSRGMVDPQQSQQLTANLTGIGLTHHDEKAEETKPKSRAAKVAIGCGIAVVAFILIVILSVVGVFLHIKHKVGARVDQWAVLQKNGGAYVSAIDKSAVALEQMRDTVLQSYSLQSENIVSQALAAVEAELGADATPRERILKEVLPEPPPVMDENAIGEDGVPVDGTSTNAPSAEQLGQDGAAAQTNDVAAVEAEAPAEAQEETEEAAEAQAPEADGETAEGLEPEVEEEPLEGLPLIAREVFLALQPVRDANRQVNVSIEQIQQMSEDAQELFATNKNQIPLFKDKDAFEESVAEFEKLLNELKEKQDGAACEVDTVKDSAEALPKAIKAAQEKLNELLGEKAKLEKEREKAAAEEAARLEEEKKAAAKAAAEEAAKQLEQNELAQLEITASEAMNSMKEHRYDEVVRSLASIRDLKSDGAKKHLKMLKLRVKAMEDLHAFLIEKISEKPVSIHFKMNGAQFHWLISEANKRNITVSNSGGDPVRVPWTKIGPVQMVPLIRHYLENPANVRKLKLIQRTQQQLNAAVYYAIFGAGNPSALKSVRNLADKIIADRPSMKDDVQLLLPELFETPEVSEDAGGEALDSEE